jgi:hypothetical protein
MSPSYNPHGKYILIRMPGHPRADNRKYVPIHVLIVESAIGHYLARPHVVHHVDGKADNNKNGNLVVCENESYHQLIHARTRALKESGDPRKRKCVFCGEYDHPENMFHSESSRHYMHRECRREYERRNRK